MIRCFTTACFCLSLAAAVSAAPALSDAQRTQLSTATDGLSPVDQGALYPLLDNALQWDPFDDRGAMVPDYAAIHANPAAHRGQVFLIEGLFIQQDTHPLIRPDPQRWGEQAVRWVVKYNPDPLGDGDDVVVVLFPDPEGKMSNPPRQEQPVRFPARFFKVWRTAEKTTGEPTDFLVFVAPAAGLTDVPASLRGTPGAGGTSGGASGGASGGGGDWGFIPLLVLLVVAMLAVWWSARRALKLRTAERGRLSQRLHPERREEKEPEEVVELRTDLPPDPAEAMRVLEAEHGDAADQPLPPPKDPAAALQELEAQRDTRNDE